ncbi:MAG TPA: class I SAM-dependent methyltransferase [Dehalococcoidia bacterium]|nr:class I SAM-dependent methyltransferase [Dehalococcoidia bacterium]
MVVEAKQRILCPLGCDVAPEAAPYPVARYRADRCIERGVSLQTRRPGWVDILRCPACGLEWLDAQIAWQTSPEDAHLGLALQYGADPQAERRRAQRFLATVHEFRRPPGRLFDIGCGMGELLRQARAAGWDVAGNDIVAGAMERLRADGFEVYTGDLTDLHLPVASFDVVTAFCVLPHLADPVEEMRSVARMLAPSGFFVAEAPADGPYRRSARALARLGIDWGVRNVYYPGHRFAFGEPSLRGLFARAGLELVAIRPFRMSAGTSARRFSLRGGVLGRLGAAGVTLADLATRASRLHNHLIAIARKPAHGSPEYTEDAQRV